MQQLIALLDANRKYEKKNNRKEIRYLHYKMRGEYSFLETD